MTKSICDEVLSEVEEALSIIGKMMCAPDIEQDQLNDLMNLMLSVRSGAKNAVKMVEEWKRLEADFLNGQAVPEPVGP